MYQRVQYVVNLDILSNLIRSEWSRKINPMSVKQTHSGNAKDWLVALRHALNFI